MQSFGLVEYKHHVLRYFRVGNKKGGYSLCISMIEKCRNIRKLPINVHILNRNTGINAEGTGDNHTPTLQRFGPRRTLVCRNLAQWVLWWCTSEVVGASNVDAIFYPASGSGKYLTS